MSFMDSLLGLFSGCYDNLDFNVHLWFLPCFFVTVVLFNVLVNLWGGEKEDRICYDCTDEFELCFDSDD